MLDMSQVVDVCIFGDPANPNISMWPCCRKLDSKGNVTQVRQGISAVFNSNTPDNRQFVELAGPDPINGMRIPIIVPPGLKGQDRTDWLVGYMIREMRKFCRDTTERDRKELEKKTKAVAAKERKAQFDFSVPKSQKFPVTDPKAMIPENRIVGPDYPVESLPPGFKLVPAPGFEHPVGAQKVVPIDEPEPKLDPKVATELAAAIEDQQRTGELM